MTFISFLRDPYETLKSELNVDNFLCDTIAEVFVVWIVAHINEREGGDAFFADGTLGSFWAAAM